MTEMLERRYQRLMRWYPAAYRAERSDEMLDTLMADATEGQRRPGARDTWALMVGGLRARAGVDRQLRMSANVWMAIRLAFVIYVSYGAIGAILGGERGVQMWIQYGAIQRPSLWAALEFGFGLLAAALGVLIWRNRRRSAVAVAVVLATSGFVPRLGLGGAANVSAAGLALVIIIASRRHPEAPRLPRSWIGIALASCVASLVWPVYVQPYVPMAWSSVELAATLFGLSVAGVAWSLVDGRLALAIAINSLITLGFWSLVDAIHGPYIAYSTGWSIARYAVPVVVAAVGIARLRRQSAL